MLQHPIKTCRLAVNLLGRESSVVVVTGNLEQGHHRLRLHSIVRLTVAGVSCLRLLSCSQAVQYEGLRLSVTALNLQQPRHNP